MPRIRTSCELGRGIKPLLHCESISDTSLNLGKKRLCSKQTNFAF